MLVEHVKNRFF